LNLLILESVLFFWLIVESVFCVSRFEVLQGIVVDSEDLQQFAWGLLSELSLDETEESISLFTADSQVQTVVEVEDHLGRLESQDDKFMLLNVDLGVDLLGGGKIQVGV